MRATLQSGACVKLLPKISIRNEQFSSSESHDWYSADVYLECWEINWKVEIQKIKTSHYTSATCPSHFQHKNPSTEIMEVMCSKGNSIYLWENKHECFCRDTMQWYYGEDMCDTTIVEFSLK